MQTSKNLPLKLQRAQEKHQALKPRVFGIRELLLGIDCFRRSSKECKKTEGIEDQRYQHLFNLQREHQVTQTMF